MKRFVGFTCSRCKEYRSASELVDGNCAVCGKEIFGRRHDIQISIPGASSRSIQREERIWDQTMSEEQRKEQEYHNEKFRSDEHWKREWHRAELHGPNDGGEALREEMTATR